MPESLFTSPLNPDNTRSSLDALKDDYLVKLEAIPLPEELKNRWLEEIEETEDITQLQQSIHSINAKITQRTQLQKQPVSKNEARFFEDNLDTPDLTEKLQQVIHEAMAGRYAEAGRGNVATVYISNASPELCYKVIVNPVEHKKECTIKQEMLFQDAAANLNVAGVRVPKPYYYHMSPEVNVCVMETLQAATLQEILIKKHRLPENFDLEAKFQALRNFFSLLHGQLGIRHGDFHNGNIMFDLNSGDIHVIDFGKSYHAFESEDYIRTQNGIPIRTMNDDHQIQKMYLQLKNFFAQEKILDKLENL